ncbi:cytochrome P450, putative [Talaromyces stipitatus ATCC 10500]|uniref:Cytochrome P450, putative n=1 Tax=Talaromyces stipitatus (strain ATCC 10500 / CBS 375.48 / QM 6759 / NRRL 1006) TaxID=441959 RepID=B8MQB1_TALSN|nr:cytochrome P450, putative [Talaromyces stipitatus ATCC 10500]EED13313.1 cytochrome P450, putative [Talaromyces stipitatus ATCC 10500]
MEEKHIQIFQSAPLLIGLAALTTVLAWFFHLIKPALLATFSRKYSSFKWVEERRGFFGFIRLSYKCVFHAKELFTVAYEKLRNTASEVFLVPFPHSSTGFLLLLPKELIAEFARQPESIISFHTYVRNAMHAQYSLFGDNVLDNNIQKPIVYRELYQKLPDKMQMMNEELVLAIKDVLDAKLNEKGEISINMWDTATAILSRASNRIIAGDPLCRNQEYLDAAVHYAISMFSLAVYLRFIPPFLRPLLAPLVRRPLSRDRDIVAKHAIPVIEERMKMIEDAEIKGNKPKVPNDLLSAALKVARKDPNSKLEYTPMMMVNRLLAFNFLQSYSNTLTMTNAVYDLISLPPEEFERTVTDIREELTRELKRPDAWSHDFVNRLVVMDSFIRESLRANPIGEVGLERIVTRENGFTFSNGLHVPRGAIIAAPLKAIQQDSANYPGGFNPRRALEDPTHPTVTTISPVFLNFGLGRPACPGRWFAVNMQKLALGHLLLEYDFQRVEVRPLGVRKVTLVEPCERSKIVLRRRSVG